MTSLRSVELVESQQELLKHFSLAPEMILAFIPNITAAIEEKSHRLTSQTQTPKHHGCTILLLLPPQLLLIA